jgi:hypothetical protein
MHTSGSIIDHPQDQRFIYRYFTISITIGNNHFGIFEHFEAEVTWLFFIKKYTYTWLLAIVAVLAYSNFNTHFKLADMISRHTMTTYRRSNKKS